MVEPVCRAREHVKQFAEKYRGVWRKVDAYRSAAARGDGWPTWPTWCFLPLGLAYEIVSSATGAAPLPPPLFIDASRLSTLAAWRTTQGVYRFDPAIYDAIRETEVDRSIPHEVLLHLPEWCVYIETPGLTWCRRPMFGAFAQLDVDLESERRALRLTADTNDGLWPMPIRLGEGSIAQSIDRLLDEGASLAPPLDINPHIISSMPTAASATAIRQDVEPLLSLVLYLCSQAAEVGDGTRRPSRPSPKCVKSGWRLFPADVPTTWEVGVRMGATLRRAAYAADTHRGGTNLAPRPHVRRAHWHGYWSGPKIGPREFELKWLPPIAVNVEDLDQLSATIRPVS